MGACCTAGGLPLRGRPAPTVYASHEPRGAFGIAPYMPCSWIKFSCVRSIPAPHPNCQLSIVNYQLKINWNLSTEFPHQISLLKHISFHRRKQLLLPRLPARRAFARLKAALKSPAARTLPGRRPLRSPAPHGGRCMGHGGLRPPIWRSARCPGQWCPAPSQWKASDAWRR